MAFARATASQLSPKQAGSLDCQYLDTRNPSTRPRTGWVFLFPFLFFFRPVCCKRYTGSPCLSPIVTLPSRRMPLVSSPAKDNKKYMRTHTRRRWASAAHQGLPRPWLMAPVDTSLDVLRCALGELAYASLVGGHSARCQFAVRYEPRNGLNWLCDRQARNQECSIVDEIRQPSIVRNRLRLRLRQPFVNLKFYYSLLVQQQQTSRYLS